MLQKNIKHAILLWENKDISFFCIFTKYEHHNVGFHVVCFHICIGTFKVQMNVVCIVYMALYGSGKLYNMWASIQNVNFTTVAYWKSLLWR